MLGRPVLLSIAAAIGSLLSVSDASAGCYSCGCGTPVVYSYAYASPCATYALPPMYVINQGPAYTMPVPIAAEPAYGYPYVGRGYRASYGATAYQGEEADEAADVYPRAYRHHHRHSYGLDYRYRHHGRPHIGMRRLYGERRFAHIPGARTHMPYRMQHRMQMHMPRLAPGVVHPQGRKHY
jgi:hypothetical protein